ncbi:hypothetical protein QTN25_009138 [Entamoeba marina]
MSEGASRYSKKNRKSKQAKRHQENTVTTTKQPKPQVETEDFYGVQMPKKYMQFLSRGPSSLTLHKGFVNDMRSDATVYCNDSLLELLAQELCNDAQTHFTSSLRQTANVTTLPGVAGSLAMPDAHSGYGFSIGGVAAMRLDDPEAVICPGGVGFDINCGVRLIRTNLTIDDLNGKLDALADALAQSVPTGVGTLSDIRFNAEDFDELLVKGLPMLVENGYAWDEDILHCEENGCIKGADPKYVTKTAKSRGYKQVGTLGSGNHYLEVQVVKEISDEASAKSMGITQVGQICVMVHCGSRGLGHQVCQDFVNVCMKNGIVNKVDKQLTGVPFNSEIGKQYFSAMNCCANFAFANRGMITYKIRNAFEKVMGMKAKKNGYASCATRAFPPGHKDVPEAYREIGQPAIIGGSMGTCSYVLVGTNEGMINSFGSTCHGAGRKMSRVKAMDMVTSGDVLRRMKDSGIRLRISNPKLAAEEADEAYKDVTDVVQTCQDAGISKIVCRLNPLIVVKG